MLRSEAEERGWALELDVAGGRATKGDVEIVVASDTPEWALLANIAEREGVGDTHGYGYVDPAALAADDQAAVERAWVELRMKRDRWVAQTDWIVATLPPDLPAAIADAVTANLAAWNTFRQQLRDLPEATTDPRTAVWPTPPAAPVVHLT